MSELAEGQLVRIRGCTNHGKSTPFGVIDNVGVTNGVPWAWFGDHYHDQSDLTPAEEWEVLLDGIYKKRHEIEVRHYSRGEPKAWLVLTPRQVRTLRMAYAYAAWHHPAPDGEKFMDMPLVVLTKEVPLHNWLMASACIDMRGDDDG